MRTRTANDEQAMYWNGDEAARCLASEARYEAMLAPFTYHLLVGSDLAGTVEFLTASGMGEALCWR